MKPTSLDELISKKAEEFADQVRAAAAMADKEEEIRIEVEKQLAFVQKEAGVKLQGKHEFTVASGRVDSVYNCVIIEYKNPASAGARIGPSPNSPGAKKVVEQIKTRFYDLRSKTTLNTLFGVGCDGNHFIFVRFYNDKWQVQDPVEVNKHSAERFLWALFNLGTRGKRFEPDYLAGDFGSAEGSVASAGIKVLYDAISTTTNPKAQTFFSQWKILFGEVCGYDVDNPSEKIKKLAKFYGVPSKGVKPAEMLFAVHTYYALFMKLLAADIMVHFHKLPGGRLVERLVNSPTAAKLRQHLDELEAGGFFRHLGITNFLEGDLFAWYLPAWTDEIERMIRAMARKLDEYNPGTLAEEPAESRDMLKKLYQQLFPKSVRHDLGEYYTPDWLAEHVLNELGYEGDPDKRILDPACGSGTFLVMAITRIRAWYEKNRETLRYDEGELCQKILTNVVGFDLNPLAVMAARTNYLIAIRDLLRRVDKIEIPIYLCDSIVTPSEYGEAKQEEMFGRPMILRTSAKPTPFVIPREVVADARILSQYGNLLQAMTPKDSGYSAEDFIDRCEDEGLPIEEVGGHEQLFNELRQLDRDNKNGVWARIIKNAFAPLFVGSVDYVVGNPPWVNWDSFPETYRNQTKPLWFRTGLFSLKGTAARLGGGKKDISMLFVYESIRFYLNDGGRLGFVITQSIFKTEGAADGFRNFKLAASPAGPEEPFKVTGVHDLSRLKVFEGAANRTAVILATRGAPTKHPVEYAYWTPSDGATIPQDESLDSVEARTRKLALVAVPVYRGKFNAPWLTVCKPVAQSLQKVVGESTYRAKAGATTCGADGVFLIRPLKRVSDKVIYAENFNDAGKREIPRRDGRLGTSFLYPVCRGKDISRWNVRTEYLVLMLQDPHTRVGIVPAELKRHPGTWDFIHSFKKELQERKSAMLPKVPFYSIYGVGLDTFAPIKVVWGRVGNTVSAAVAESAESDFLSNKTILPFEAMMIPFDHIDEAHFVCGCLNSSPAQLVIIGSIVLHPDTHVLRRVNVPHFDRHNADHVAISTLSRELHRVTSDGSDPSDLEIELDARCCALWDLGAAQLTKMRNCLNELRPARSRARNVDN